ncbi:PEP/pyruvate-binding domain-containing protein [Dokdonia donghaensis]|uniref:Phosphoenolpyruvate synthase n=1 Tax=Dokdonia donghaensis DSW-1 TaxID=1300343 RepID=A0A0A2GTL4_9FLAO|nr:PEP/pyruvate-binding domain-containing protein [Dokdonia donghaensis]ANH61127.1 phosphoenolpyruvate synthase [Dokdonia donghaensis DSW-1]KGO05656.1 phosphoenolpyruvate synthase [Dokdonia donghaensis DSW-1]
MIKIYKAFLVILSFVITNSLVAQDLPVATIQKNIESFKENPRGPYKKIEWFCEDGTMREARDPCPDDIGGGVQHASYSEDLITLGTKYHLFFADILANTDKVAFWDVTNDNSRIKQYQLARYLASVDNGWVQRKSQFYRGAIQSEDEEAWGVEFYEWLLRSDTRFRQNYYLLRQTLRDIPHDGDSNIAQRMRSESKILAETYPKFMDARIKIHGKPSVSDIQMVQEFRAKHKGDLSDEVKKQFDQLEKTLAEFYTPINFKELQSQVNAISVKNDLTERISTFLEKAAQDTSAQTLVPEIADVLCYIRQDVLTLRRSSDRLAMLDLSNELEDILLLKTQEWQPETLKELLYKIQTLSYAATGTGLIELNEWAAVEPYLQADSYHNDKSVEQLNDFLATARGVVEWSASQVKAKYQEVVDTYATFEPKAYGFIDDRVRSSVALDLGESVSTLGAFIAKHSGLENKVMDIDGQSSVRGLNPGYAYGELVVIEGSPEGIEVDTEKIYVFEKPPSDLKPVAGIMTVSEGNLVSHVQLLARNLGIPNAALSQENLQDLSKYSGKKVFYAVSNKGSVIIKGEDDITDEERELFSKKQRSTSQVTVPVEKIALDKKDIINMRDLDASASGKLVGPKAANLGQLKKMFPEQVVEGLVIPFGIFKDHMDQKMTNYEGSYWEFLNNAFAKAEQMKSNGASSKEIETFQLQELKRLREAINMMTLKPSFVNSLRADFQKVFKSPMGKTPVFLRSDTNMEDLEEFTGAGLNLTLFNILDEDKILKGIKDVWASPYTERSFKWRQQYLSNPENVFPSILIIPSVDVEYSGVMITKGINQGTDKDLTIAFSRGAGGAVDGQAAETRLVTATDTRLLSPARQADYIRLPATGGVKKNIATFDEEILNEKNIKDIRAIAQSIRTRLPEMTGSDYDGAYDVELGFENDKLWLFQIRPFVENKTAKSSEYLEAISPKIDNDFLITLDAPIN